MAVADPEAAKQRLQGLCGQLVQFPLDFLEKENWSSSNVPFAPQSYAPTALFV